MKEFECEVKERLEQEGWTVLRDGWPDFLCIRLGANGEPEIQAVEVKSESDFVRWQQRLVLSILSTRLPVLVMKEGPGWFNEGRMHAETTDYLLPVSPLPWKTRTKEIFKFIIQWVKDAKAAI